MTASLFLRGFVLPQSYNTAGTHCPTMPRCIFFKNQCSHLQEESVQIILTSWLIIFTLLHICALDKLSAFEYLALSSGGSGKTGCLIAEAREKVRCQEVKL